MLDQRERENPMEQYHDDDEDDDDDRELPDESDEDDDDDASVDTIACPSCGREVYEQAERCPHCGSYVSREGPRSQRRPLWLIVGVVLCLLIVLLVWTLR
jgi:hypothetical protein